MPRTPDKYTSRGIGELINIALKADCQTIFVGVGGTASIDAGQGILEVVDKEKLGDRLFILGHHYQRDEVIQFADTTGDSFKLAKDATKVLVKVQSKLVPYTNRVMFY